jgi:hypothetical protein
MILSKVNRFGAHAHEYNVTRTPRNQFSDSKHSANPFSSLSQHFIQSAFTESPNGVVPGAANPNLFHNA